MKHLFYFSPCAAIIAALINTSSASAQVIYNDDFENISLVSGAGAVSFGYDSTPSGGATKAIQYGDWGRQGQNSTNTDVDGDTDKELLPNKAGANNAKVWGTIIDPGLFTSTGSGSYSFSVDLIGADTGTSRIYLWSASGYDASGSHDLIMDLAQTGFTDYVPLSGTGDTVVNEIFMYDIADETASGNYSTNFNYTEGDTLVVLFASYNTALAYDNLVISVNAGSDTDSDGLDDSVETGTGVYVDPNDTGTDPNNADTDADGLTDGDEVTSYNTNPNLQDTDGDTLSDFEEVVTLKTSPTNTDTNDDGLSDLVLITAGYNGSVDYSALLTDTVLNPLGFSTSAQPEPPVAGANAVVAEKSNGSATVQMQMERSTDLINWTSDANDLLDVNLNVSGDEDYVRFSIEED
jgi:hypothetical protein